MGRDVTICAGCGLDTEPGRHLCCRSCWRRYHPACFRVEGFPNRLDETALCARLGDCRRADFQCEVCNFRTITGRAPATADDYVLCYLDRMLTIDEMHHDADNMTNTYALRQTARWGLAFGVPMLAGNVEELRAMPDDHRQLGWFFVWKSLTVKFQSIKRMRACIWNYYRTMPGLAVEDIPTSTRRFTDRADGLLQRLGGESEQALVFPTILLDALLELLASDWKRARGEYRVELALANLAVHVMFAAGMRANECFAERTVRFSKSFVVGEEAEARGVPPHFFIVAPPQTKEERHEVTRIPCSYTTAAPCRLRPGMWGQLALAELERVGRGAATGDTTLLLFADAGGAQWRMGWLWATHVEPRLEQLQRERNGGLTGGEDLTRFGSNSPRRTWTSMASSAPNAVSATLLEYQARWRKQARRRGARSMPMHAHYFDPDINERLKATHFLSSIGPRF